MSEHYWKIFVDEFVEDILGIALNEKQRADLTKSLLHHRDMEYEACGYIEADKSVRRMNDKDARLEMVRHVEQLTQSLSSAPGKVADLLSDGQKLDLARLFNFREYLRREEKIDV